ncbi:MAG: hypothetical protein EA374_06340 [Acholeplasmatales bacterium]|nr:MAG: hypothetical protein EA374_06340 [Acholeplasmatales bacterium]
MKKIGIIMFIFLSAFIVTACTMAPSRTRIFFVGVEDFESVNIREDGFYEIPEVSKVGYDFAGWYFDNDFTRPYANDGSISAATTLYARFEARAYTVTFISEDSVLLESSQRFADPIEAPQPDIMAHRVFVGWRDVADGSLFTEGVVPARDLTLEALYEWVSYAVNVTGKDESFTLTHQETFSDLPEPTREGYMFQGWYFDAMFTEPLELTASPEDDITLFARFEPASFQLVFKTENGNVIDPMSIPYQNTITLPAEPVRPGYTFGGWYTDPNYENYVFPGTVMPANNLVMYARWIEQSTIEVTQSLQTVITDMVERAALAFVGVRNDRGDNGGGTGSGIVYKHDGDRYYVVTNHHVIEDFVTLTLTYQRFGILFEIEFADIEFIGSDPTTDIAVLSFTSPVAFEAVDFADSYALKLGQFVFAMGNPLGFDNFGTVTMGVVSGLTRFKQLDTLNTAFIQHDAAINRGNSGGPLFTLDGHIAGINTLKTMRDSQGDATEGLGFAVPANTVLRVVRDLESFGEVRRPFLGILANPVYGTCGQTFGVCVTGTTPGSAAEAAGLRENDIITGYKTQNQDTFVPVFNFDQLREVILNSRVGDVVQIQFIRDGETIESPEVVLGVHPDDA